MERQGKQKRLLRRQRTRRIELKRWNCIYATENLRGVKRLHSHLRIGSTTIIYFISDDFDYPTPNWYADKNGIGWHHSKGRFDNQRHRLNRSTRDEVIFNQVADYEIENLDVI